MLKKILGISAVAFFAVTAAACSTGSTADTAVTADQDAEGTETHGAVLPLPDVSGDMKAKGAKTDISALAEKYKPHVELAEYKGVKVTKGDAYEMTAEEVEDELEMMAEGLKEYEDVTEGGTTQEGDFVTITTEATLDGQPYDIFSLQDQDYEIGSEYIAEDFDNQLVGKKAGEEFEIKVTFPDDYMEEEFLDEGEVSINGKTIVFKTKISSIERAAEEKLDDEWVKAHQEDLEAYGYDGANTLEELKAKIKSVNDEYRAKSLLEERGGEALSYVISQSKFSSYPEDELNLYKDNTKANMEQEYEAYKDMLGVSTLEEYLEMGYEIKGESALDEYATDQAQQYLQKKMVITLIADAAGIEAGEEDINEIGNKMAQYYNMESYDAMIAQYGEKVKENMLFQTLYTKVISYLGSQADPSLEPETSEDDILMDDIMEEESETSAAG